MRLGASHVSLENNTFATGDVDSGTKRISEHGVPRLIRFAVKKAR